MKMVNFVHTVLDFKKLSPAQKIATSFLFVILAGTILLMLPISNRDGQFFSPIDALFTATSATCVTGLSTVTIADQYNWFGHCIIDSDRRTWINDIYGGFDSDTKESFVIK